MTKPRYQHGCAAGSQVSGKAAAGVPVSAWNVNANNGNVNNNHRNNRGYALAVRRAGEFRGAGEVSYRSLYDAWRRARRKKRPSHNQLRFEIDWSGNLLQLQRDILAGTWSPRPSTCFIATRPKAREIHAPDFFDRVVHHWWVLQVEAIYEPIFIFDSYANRKGKGSHAAVRRAQSFMRQMQSGEGGGWYLQLDIHNFFNSIPRRILWQLLKARLERAGVPPHVLQVGHALLRHSPLRAGVKYRATPAELELVPRHKRLENADPGDGLPIGNLSSQFLANVLLHELDVFVKHTLRAKRYLRYVDDFVLFHRDRDQLVRWQAEIERFLAERLQLRLKPDIRLRRLTDGLDFLGYIIRPTHNLARRRVVGHAMSALAEWEHTHVRGNTLRVTPQDLQELQARVASYGGHLRHASSYRLQARLHDHFPWLAAATVRRRFPARRMRRAITLKIRRYDHARAAGST